MAVKLRPQTLQGYAIFNHSGTPWSAVTFASEYEADQYLKARQAEWGKRGWGDLSKHSVQHVNITIEPALKESSHE